MAVACSEYTTRDTTVELETQPEEAIITTKDGRKPITSTVGSIYEAVAHLIMDETRTGTGFLCKVKRDYFLLTSAHNVVKIGEHERTFAETVQIFFGRTGIEGILHEAITVCGTEFHIPMGYLKPTSQHDWAKLNMNAYIKNLPNFHFTIPEKSIIKQDEVLYVCGYPEFPSKMSEQTPGTPGYPQFSLWMSECEHGWYVNPHHIAYQEWTSKGNSGSPVFYKDKHKHHIIGVHVGYIAQMNVNMAVKITEVFDVTECFPLVSEIHLHEDNTLKRGAKLKQSTTESHRKLFHWFHRLRRRNKNEVVSAAVADKVIVKYTGKVQAILPGCQLPTASITDITIIPGNRLCVSDYRTSVLTCLTEKGAAVWKFTPQEGKVVARAKYIECAGRLIVTLQNRSNAEKEETHIVEPRMYFMSLNGELQERVGPKIASPIDIASGLDEFYVLCQENKYVYTLEATGAELHRFSVDYDFAHIAYLPVADTIVLSDWESCFIGGFSMSGVALWNSSRGGSGPCAMCATPDGSQVFICDRRYHRVLLLSSDGNYIKNIVDQENGILWPTAVACNSNGDLYVAEAEGLILFVALNAGS